MYINQKDALSQEKTTLSRASLDVSPPENTTPSRKNAISPTTTLKVGLYTPQTEWLEAKLNEIPNLLTERIDEPTGLYLSLEHSTETSASRFQPLWDFDDADNPERGLADARRFVQLLCESGIPLHALMPFASGRKGIHIAAKHLLQPRTDWYSVFAHAAEHLWAEEFPTLDAGIYKNRALIRAPFSYHQTVERGWRPRKKPLEWEMFFDAQWADIRSVTLAELNDAQWADIHLFIRDALPTDEPTPDYWNRFASELLFDWQKTALQKRAVASAQFRKFLRFNGDFHHILDEARLDYREQKNRHGHLFSLRECPYCHGKDKAWVNRAGFLHCFRDSCSANDGIPLQRWAAHCGVSIEKKPPDAPQRTPLTVERRAVSKTEKRRAEDASEKLRQELSRIHHLQPNTALLVQSTPGVGKTTHTLDHVLRFSGRVLVATDTRQRALELFEQYKGDDAHYLVGRNEGNCEDYERIQIVGLKGYMPGKVVCPACPFFPANAKKTGTDPCHYYQQFRFPSQEDLAQTEPPRVTFCTYEQALYLHEAARLDADLIILDEDPSRAFMQKREIQLGDLVFSQHAYHPPLRQFAQVLRETLAAASVETEEQHAVYRSQLLVDLLQLAAARHGLDLLKLIDGVENCIGNVYDKPGRLAKTPLDELEALPPAYLLELAKAIREELKKAGGKIQDSEGKMQDSEGKMQDSAVGQVSYLTDRDGEQDSEGRMQDAKGLRQDSAIRNPNSGGCECLQLSAVSHQSGNTAIPKNAIRNPQSNNPQSNDWNSPLSVFVHKGVATLNFYQRVSLTFTTPIVILDAYGREAYYRALLNREVSTIRVEAEIHANVLQVKLATSKRAFHKRRDALFRRLSEVIDAFPSHKTLIYTHAAQEKRVKTAHPDCTTQHFWSGRGVDEFKDHGCAIIFGTAEPDPQGLLSASRALHVHDPIPIDGSPHPEDHRHRADPRLETLLQMRREEEMLQAAHRTRPAWAEGNAKTIVIISQLDLPGLPADSVIDPRAIQFHRRKMRFSQFIDDCLEQMGFYFDGLAELSGVVCEKSKTVKQLRQRLASTASLINESITDPVKASWDGGQARPRVSNVDVPADSLYPENRTAFSRDRDAILSRRNLDAENVTFTLATERGTPPTVTIRVWGSAVLARAWLEALVSDRMSDPTPFTLDDLLAVCRQYAIQLAVLLDAPTAEDVYWRLFTERSISPDGGRGGGEGAAFEAECRLERGNSP